MARNKLNASEKVIPIVISLLVLAVVLAGCFIWANSSTPTSKDPVLHFALGEATMKGYVGADVYYDREPVDVSIKAADGTIYDQSNADIYKIDKDRKVVTIMKDTGDLGKWTIGYNTKSNKNITFSFLNTASPTLYINDGVRLVHNKNDYYVEFQPMMFVKDLNATAYYSVSIINKKDSNRNEENISTGHVAYNELAYALFEPSILAYTGDTYDVVVTVQSEDNQTASASFELKLSELPEDQK